MCVCVCVCAHPIPPFPPGNCSSRNTNPFPRKNYAYTGPARILANSESLLDFVLCIEGDVVSPVFKNLRSHRTLSPRLQKRILHLLEYLGTICEISDRQKFESYCLEISSSKMHDRQFWFSLAVAVNSVLIDQVGLLHTHFL